MHGSWKRTLQEWHDAIISIEPGELSSPAWILNKKSGLCEPLSIFIRDLLPEQAGPYTRAVYRAWAIPLVVTTSGKQEPLHVKI